MPVLLAPLVPAAGAALAKTTGGALLGAATYGLVNGLSQVAGVELGNQIAEWVRSIGGEWDSEAGIGGIDGCKKISDGGYGTLLTFVNGQWTVFAGGGLYATKATEILSIKIVSSENRGYSPAISYKYVGGAFEEGANVDWFDTREEAAAVRFKIEPTEGECAEYDQPTPEPLPSPYQLPPMQSGDCEINVAFHGFLRAEDGTGTVRPVFEFTPAVDPSRASGGIIVGECNFQPTITVGSDGDGGDPPVIIPTPPRGPDDEPRGEEWWKALVKGAAAGAVGALVNELIEGLLTKQAPSEFSLIAPCDVNEEGDPLEAFWLFPEQSRQERMMAHQEALMELMQQHLNWKTPICTGEKEEKYQHWRSIRFEQDEPTEDRRRRVTKLFRYRGPNAGDPESLGQHWRLFEWNTGPIIVWHSGSPVGSPKVWAATADEGKRVIRHAFAEVGLDPDQVGKWAISGSDHPRYGVRATVSLKQIDGCWSASCRPGPNGWPELPLVSPHP